MSKIHKGIKLKKIVSKEDQYYLLLDEIGNDLERLRVTKNITQKQLAESLGTSQSYISKIENGTVSPSIKSLFRIAAELDDSLVAPTFKSLLNTGRNTASDESKTETMHDKKNLLPQRSANFKLRDKHQKV